MTGFLAFLYVIIGLGFGAGAVSMSEDAKKDDAETVVFVIVAIAAFWPGFVAYDLCRLLSSKADKL